MISHKDPMLLLKSFEKINKKYNLFKGLKINCEDVAEERKARE